jgi:hypothetical protein
MPYERLLHDGRIRPHRTNRQEIAGLFQVVERDLADAAIVALSADRRFATAYNAALQAATAGGITITEAEDLLKEARAFAELARRWIQARHPGLM